MKRFNFSTLLVVVFCLFANQVFSAIILKKDDPGTGTIPGPAPTKSITFKSSASIPVMADIIGSELIVDFTSALGTASVSVVDETGNVVYQTIVDTYSASEVVIPVDELSSGKYALKISYASTRLTGDFEL
ncbi:MAG: DUF3244 domain-containing protein [Paludibacter sp.]